MSLIVFEDEHLLVINKPAGWNTHSPSPYAGEGVYEWLKNREPRWARLAIVHRLDKETSGLLVFGKTPQANRVLTGQFTARSVRKKYLLFTDRPVTPSQFTVTSTLSRAGEKYVSRPAGSGARAETRFKVVSVHEGRTCVEAEPVTGRTHQIRVHAAEHGFPILGDRLYGGTAAPRVFLHSAELSFNNVSGATVRFEAAPDWMNRNRLAMVDARETDAFRIIHGAADAQPGIYVDKLAGWLLAQTADDLNAAQLSELKRLAGEFNCQGVYHKRLSRNVRGGTTAESSPQLVFGAAAPERFTILENGLRFEVSFHEGYSVGLFLDQRDNRRRFGTSCVAADFFLPHAPSAQRNENLRGVASSGEFSVLNVFAYTCAFSVAAAKAGALTASLDLSKKYLEWGRRNFDLNGLEPAQHDFIYGGAFDWMRRLAKKGRAFDVIALDPPTFSQSKESGVWQAEKHYGKLVEAALPLLKPEGVLFAATNAARLEPEKFLGMVAGAVTKARRRIIQQHYAPQPPDFPVSRGEPAYLKTVWLRIG